MVNAEAFMNFFNSYFLTPDVLIVSFPFSFKLTTDDFSTKDIGD